MLKYLMLKAYYYITNQKRINKFRNIDKFLQKVGGKTYTKSLGQLKYKLRFKRSLDYSNALVEQGLQFGDYEKRIEYKELPVISSIIILTKLAPNLIQCLESIYQQSYKAIEVIVIYDDRDRELWKILWDIAEKYRFKTETVLLPCYDSNFFKCFNKGLVAANGALIWVIDEICTRNKYFLEKLAPVFEVESAMASMATKDTEKGLTEESEEKIYYLTANDFVKEMYPFTNLQFSISNMVLRNIGPISDKMICTLGNMPYYGKVQYVLNLIRGGTIGFVGGVAEKIKTNNRNSNNTVSNLMEWKELAYFVSKYYSFGLSNTKKVPHIIMACYAIKSGGGETFPIYLANELKRLGMTVTILNFDLEKRERSISDLIHSDIPIINMKHTDFIGPILQHMKGDIIHTHHATVDYAVSLCLAIRPEFGKHIVTLHGMYETISDIDCTRVINSTKQSVYKYVYLADKNLECFKLRGEYDADRFIKIRNGLPQVDITPIKRKMLQIKEDDFVLVLASRGIPEKGWLEACKAINIVNESGGRSVHLVILGNGEVKKQIKESEYIHLMGSVSNVRDYFAMGDAGLLPSRYKGESYPLTVMECLMSGKPVIATDIAEVANQITDKDGNRAGILIPLKNWSFRIEDLAEAIFKLANDRDIYNLLKNNAKIVSKQFDIAEVVKEYIQLYKDAELNS